MSKRKQKFFRGQRVKIADELSDSMNYFECGCEAVVKYSYDDKYGGGDVESYSLMLDLPEDIHSCSWYDEDQLTLIDGDRDKGELFLQENKWR